MSITVYKRIVEITEAYLGPASGRFIDRQISFHLDKLPIDITLEDVHQLESSIGVVLGMLTNDKTVVASFSQDLATKLY